MAELTRAIGKFLSDMTNAPAFADEEANRGYERPCLEVALVSEMVTRRFAGRVSYYEEPKDTDPEGTVKVAIKEEKRTATLRVTTIAKATTQKSAHDGCVDLRNAIRDGVMNAVFGTGSSKVSDPQDATADLGVYRMRTGREFGPDADLSGEPKVYRASIEIIVERRHKTRRPITQRVGEIQGMTYEVEFA